MTRHRALTSTIRSVIALFTALVVSVVGASALPAAAFAGHGQSKGHQANRADKPGKAHGKAQAHNQAKARMTSKNQRNGKSQERTSSGTTQKSSGQQAAPTQSSRGRSAQAHEGKTSQGSAKPAGGPSDKDPQGNNGTIKLAGFGGSNGPGHSSGDGSTPMHPSNDPHLPCDFSVEWFGFDSGVTSDVTFVQHAPTRGGSAQHDSVTLDGDGHIGGGSTAGYDGVQDYSLSFEGDPHPKHGYHVKLTVNTPYSQGSDTKHKVFWVEPCKAEVPDEEGEVPDENNEDNKDNNEDNQDNNQDNNEDNKDNAGVEDEVDDNGNTTVFGVQDTATEVLGVQASVRGSQSAPQAARAEVPTAVEAGLSGEEWSRSVLPFLVVLLGLATTFVALARRRARA